MVVGSLQIEITAEMSRLAQQMRQAKQVTSESMSAIEASMADVQKAIDSMSVAEQRRAGVFARTWAETKRLLGVVSDAMQAHSQTVSQMKDKYAELEIPVSAFKSLQSWKEQAAYAIGAGVGLGIDKAKDAWDRFKTWMEEKLKTTATIAGVAFVTGISAVILSGVYALYKSVSFIFGLLTGESYKSANIDALSAMNKEVKTLQENLPLTAVGASALNEALKMQGTSADGYAATLGSVSAAVRTNEEELTRLGVQYKDQNGNLLTTEKTLASAAVVLATYKEGWDRTQAAQAIGMGSEKQIHQALAITAEKTQTAKDRLIAYGLVIGEGTQEQVTRYQDAMRAFERESDLTSQGFKRAVADNIMPILADLAEFFRDGFPRAVMAFRYSLATIMSLFYGLKTVVFMVAESIVGSLSAIGSVITGLAMAAWKAMKGDFSGARDAFLSGWEDAKARLGGIGDNIIAQARNNSAAMAQAWGADSLTAQQTADTITKTGKAWVGAAKDQGKATEDVDAGYRRLVKTLQEKMQIDGSLLEQQRLQIELDALSEKQRAAITPEREAYLRDLAKQVDLLQRLHKEQAEQDRQDSVLTGLNDTQSEARKSLEFETKLLQMEAPLAAAALLNKTEELKLTSAINTQKAIASALNQADIEERQALFAIGNAEDEQSQRSRENIMSVAKAHREALPDLIKAREAARLQNDLAKNSVSEFQNLFNTIESTGRQVFIHVFSDGKNAFEGIGKALKASVIDLLYQLTLKKWILSVQANVAGSMGVGGSSGAGGGMMSLGSLYNAGSGLYNFATNGMGLMSSSAAYAAAVPGLTSFGAGSQAAMLAAQTGEFGAAGLSATASAAGSAGAASAVSAIAAAAPYAIAAFAAYQLLKGNGGTPSYALPEGGTGAALSKQYQALAAQFGAQGVATFGYGANTGRDSQNPNFALTAGLNGRSVFGVGEDLGGIQALTPENVALQSSRAVLAALKASVLPGYLKTFFDSIAPETMDQAALDNALAFAGSLKSIKDQLGAMGLASASASDGLITLLGALGNAPDLLGQYYTNFYSDSERTARAISQVDEQLAKLGVSTIPMTRDEFRALVEAQDLSTAAGQQMFAGLMQLSPAFAAVTAALTETVTVAQQLKDVTGTASSAVDALIQSTQAAANAARQSADQYRSLAATLNDAAQRVMGGGRGVAAGRLDALYATSRTGDAAALSALPQAADDFLAASKATARTSLDYARDQARVVGMLTQAGMTATGMANWQDYQAGLLQAQTGVLENIKDILSQPSPDAGLLSEQINLLSSIGDLLSDQTKQVMTGNGTQAAIRNISALNSGLSEEMLRQLVTGSSTQNGTLQGVLDGSAQTIGLLRQLVNLTAQQVAETDAAKAARDAAYAADIEASRNAAADKAAADAASAAAAAAAVTSTVTASAPLSFDKFLASRGYTATYDEELGMRVYGTDGERVRNIEWLQQQYEATPHAMGGIASGLSLLGERGPEIADFTSPARIYTAEQTRGMFAPRNDGALISALDELRTESRALRSEVASMRRDTKKTADTLDAVANGQLSFSTEAA